MAVDAAVLKAVEEKRSPPTVRFYGWEPWCVSLGYFQKPSEEFDRAALQERGWDFVLRPTGGRAVLHAEELTYSLIARRDEAAWCSTLAVSHERIGWALAAALNGFGLSVVGAHPSTGSGTALPRLSASTKKSITQQSTLPCFASTSRAELAFGERKVVGSAQRRTREAFLQHGSIPLTPDHERLVEILRLNEEQRAAYLDSLRSHAMSLSEIRALPENGFEEGFLEMAKAMLAALEVTGEPGVLTEEELKDAQEFEKAHLARQQAFFKQDNGVLTPS